MNGLPYYKAYPRDFIEGTIGWSFELKGAYRLILDLIYMQGGRLPDDAKYISGLLGCSQRKWGVLREQLIESGKITLSEGYLSNHRAIIELKTLRRFRDNQAINRSRPNKNNDLQSPKPNHTDTDTEATSVATRVSASRRAELDDLEKRLREAAGLESSPSPKLFDLSPILSLIDAGVDLDRVILPKIRSMRDRAPANVSTWRYFAAAIEGDLTRQSSKPNLQLSPTGEPWPAVLEAARSTRRWMLSWGPPPGEAGCLVPADLIRPTDGCEWQVKEKAA